MKISVDKYTLEPNDVDGGTAGSHGVESLEFDFSPEWNGLSRTVTFFPPKSVAKCVAFTGTAVPLPPEVTARAGRTAYVLCGARDGQAIITLTGAVTVAETLLPSESQTEEHTPGALERVTLLCEEARIDAQSAAASAQSALRAGEEVAELADELISAGRVVTEVYNEIKNGIYVHEKLTELNRTDKAHAVSAKGLYDKLEELMSLVCPFKVKAVDSLPEQPDTSCIYLYEGKSMVYSSAAQSVKLYSWTPTYIESGGPGFIFTKDAAPTEGTDVYWSGIGTPVSMDDLILFDTIVEMSGETYTASGGSRFTLSSAGELTVAESGTASDWHELGGGDDLTLYLKEGPMLRLLKGGLL